MNTVKNPLFIFLVLAVAVSAAFIWYDLQPPKSDLDQTRFGPDAEGIEIEAENGASFEILAEPIDEAGERKEFVESQIPNLNRPIKASESVSAETRERITFGISEITQTLKDNYNYLQGWLELGILRKQMGDYEGAIEAWNFASVLKPNVATPLLNLADLHAFYIKDRQKAEKYFLDAVKAEPQNGYSYFQLANFYRDILQNKAKAREILEQGISAGADPTGDLQSLLNSL